jgi:hypothetical protein
MRDRRPVTVEVRANGPGWVSHAGTVLLGGSRTEIRCYIRDPDGHLIEVAQTKDQEKD